MRRTTKEHIYELRSAREFLGQCDHVLLLLFFCFSSHPLKGGTGCHGHHLHKDNKGTNTALMPSLCTFPLLKTVRNFHLGPESADNARFLSADGLFERF